MTELSCKPQKAGAWTWSFGLLAITCRPDAFAKLERFAKRIGCTLEDLLRCQKDAEAKASLPPPPDCSTTITIRGERQRAFEGEQVPVRSAADLATLVTRAAEGTLLTWDSDLYGICDIDWHGVEPPGHGFLIGMVTALCPTPAAWWFSRSGGLHLLYGPLDGIPGLLWASAAAVAAADRFPTATGIEAIRKTRRASAPIVGVQSAGAALSAWRAVVQGGVDGVDDWLAERGMEIGGRYTHDHCVIAPDGKLGNPSVSVLTDGIHCFRCGFRGWGAILATNEITGMVWEMAGAWCWQSQVMAILRDQYGSRITESALRQAYQCLLMLLHHPDDPRVFLAMMDTEVYRTTGGSWVAKDLKLIQKEVLRENYMTVFPGFRRFRLDENGQWEKQPDNVEIRANYQGTTELRGIPELAFVRGAKIYGQHLVYPDAAKIYRIQSRSASKFPFCYRQDRPDVEELRGMVDEYFPNIDWQYLLLCIAARGYAESSPGMPPIILAHGNSGSGKTTTPLIAARFCDETAAFVPNIEDDQRWSECFGSKSRESAFVILDELTKMPKQAVVRERLIALRREYSYRALYIGPVTRQLDNVIIGTGITIPDELLSSEQLGRRALSVQLQQRELDWHRRGCGNLMDNWRDDQERAKLADWVVSHIIDEYFVEPLDFVSQIAPQLGGVTLRQFAASGEGMDFRKVLRKFLAALAAMPETDKGGGWRAIERGGFDPVNDLWNQLCDDSSTEGFGRSEKLMEKPIGQTLGLDYSVYFKAQRHGSKVFVRFTDTKETRGRGEYKTTDQIWKDMVKATGEK